jgi:hypothetical protein
MTTTYNGWTNHETWVTKLWLDNTPGDQDFQTELFESLDGDTRRIADAVQVAIEGSVCGFDHTDDAFPLGGLAADLLGSALSAVNWWEIAEAIISDNEE